MICKEEKSIKNRSLDGCNNHCTDLHSQVRKIFLLWNDQRRQRFGDIYDQINKVRKNFKYALLLCRVYVEIIKKINLVILFYNWKDINSLKNKKLTVFKKLNDVENP